MTAMEVKMTVSDPPQVGKVRYGWYKIDNEWWLTRDELKKEFKLSNKQLSNIVLSSRKGRVNEGKLRTAVRFNRYNDKDFIVYNLDDFNALFQKLKQQEEGLLSQEEVL